MDVRELNREQLSQLKQQYLTELSESGEFSEVVGRDYDAPSWYDMANADSIVPDDVIFRNFEGINFVKEDFWELEHFIYTQTPDAGKDAIRCPFSVPIKKIQG